jgi:hypothetical protein
MFCSQTTGSPYGWLYFEPVFLLAAVDHPVASAKNKHNEFYQIDQKVLVF